MAKFRHASFENVTIGNIVVHYTESGRLKKKKKVVIPVNWQPPKKTARKSFGCDFSQWDRGDLERVFESIPDVNIDQIIENSKNMSSKKASQEEKEAKKLSAKKEV